MLALEPPEVSRVAGDDLNKAHCTAKGGEDVKNRSDASFYLRC